MFERGNPYGKTDPSGHVFIADDITIATGALLVVGLYYLASAIAPPIIGPAISEGIADATKAYTKAGETVGNVLDAFRLGEALEKYRRNPTPENEAKLEEVALAIGINQGVGKEIDRFGGGNSASKIASGYYGSNGFVGDFVSNYIYSKSNEASPATKSKGSSSGGGGGKCGINMSCVPKIENSGSSPPPKGTTIPGGGKCGVNVSCK